MHREPHPGGTCARTRLTFSPPLKLHPDRFVDVLGEVQDALLLLLLLILQQRSEGKAGLKRSLPQPNPPQPPFPPGQLRRFLHHPLYSTATEITPRQLRTSAERGERLPSAPRGGAAPSSPPSCPRRHRRRRHPRRRSPFHLPPPEVTSPPG